MTPRVRRIDSPRNGPFYKPKSARKLDPIEATLAASSPEVRKMRGQLILVWLAAATVPAAGGTLPFITDDFARAQAEARARHVPVFVDVWAPW